MADPQDGIDEAIDDVDEIADDTSRWTLEESLEIFEGLQDHCRVRIAALRQDIEARR